MKLLNRNDCVSLSDLENYENTMVILDDSNLKEEYKTALNQIWLATHGPGCRLGSFTGTVHLTHPVDKDRLAVHRNDILGIIKPQILEDVCKYYNVNLQNITEDNEEMER